MKILLIGYMGSGKSTIGKRLAKELHMDFIDMDDWIEERAGQSIGQIFKDNGVDHFRLLETKTLTKLSKKENLVIATGGGAPCFNNNIRRMLEMGKVIYLQSSPEKLANRLQSETDHRPILKGKNDKALLKFIKEQLAERRKFYNQAHLTIRTCNPISQIVDRIIFRLKNE